MKGCVNVGIYNCLVMAESVGPEVIRYANALDDTSLMGAIKAVRSNRSVVYRELGQLFSGVLEQHEWFSDDSVVDLEGAPALLRDNCGRKRTLIRADRVNRKTSVGELVEHADFILTVDHKLEHLDNVEVAKWRLASELRDAKPTTMLLVVALPA